MSIINGEHPIFTGDELKMLISISIIVIGLIYTDLMFCYYIFLVQAALLQHANRSIYQASIWTTSMKTKHNIPIPKGFGWSKSARSWEPLWTLLPEAAKACRELLKCGCKAQPLCTRKCRCQNAALSCTALCKCGGKCDFT